MAMVQEDFLTVAKSKNKVKASSRWPVLLCRYSTRHHN